MNKFLVALSHLLLLALVTAVGAYWGVRILTPQPMPAPPPMAVAPPRDPDPIAAARMFGLVQVSVAAVSNIQVLGVFAAGVDSSAILVVDGKPARAFVIGQEVTPSTTLAEVGPDKVTLQGAGGRQELRAPARPLTPALSTSGPTTPQSAFIRQGNTISAGAAGASSRPSAFNSLRPLGPMSPVTAPPPVPGAPMEPQPGQEMNPAPGQPAPQNTPPVAQ